MSLQSCITCIIVRREYELATFAAKHFVADVVRAFSFRETLLGKSCLLCNFALHDVSTYSACISQRRAHACIQNKRKPECASSRYSQEQVLNGLLFHRNTTPVPKRYMNSVAATRYACTLKNVFTFNRNYYPDNTQCPQDVLKRSKRPHWFCYVLRRSSVRQCAWCPINVYLRTFSGCANFGH